jgi:hypothetical protein
MVSPGPHNRKSYSSPACVLRHAAEVVRASTNYVDEMSITDDDLETTNSAIAKLEGIEPSGDLGEFNSRKLTFGPDKAVIGPVAHLAAERIRLTALDWEHFEVRQVGATLGGIVKGLDLSKPLADEVFEELRRAWVDYKVLFFRDQVLTAEQHIEFARRFGELEVHPFLRNNDERPELVRFAKDADTGGYENGWHHDVTWREVPSKGAILRAIQVPETGGDTLFCDMNAAYEGLSDDIKDRIEVSSPSTITCRRSVTRSRVPTQRPCARSIRSSSIRW